MAFIKVKLGDAKEKEPVAEGTYLLTVEDAELQEDDKGRNVVVIRHNIENEPQAMPVWHRIYLPDDNDDEEKANNKLLFAKRYCDKFGIPYKKTGFELDDILGAQAEVQLTVEEYNGRFSNRIKL